jgi:hypothetical protein
MDAVAREHRRELMHFFDVEGNRQVGYSARDSAAHVVRVCIRTMRVLFSSCMVGAVCVMPALCQMLLVPPECNTSSLPSFELRGSYPVTQSVTHTPNPIPSLLYCLSPLASDRPRATAARARPGLAPCCSAPLVVDGGGAARVAGPWTLGTCAGPATTPCPSVVFAPHGALACCWVPPPTPTWRTRLHRPRRPSAARGWGPPRQRGPGWSVPPPGTQARVVPLASGL